MAFTMEQGAKHSPIRCLAFEHDSSKESFVTGRSSLNKNARAHVSECLALSTALEPSNKLLPLSTFSLGMSYEQAQDTHDGGGASGGAASTPDVAPCTPCPSFLQQKSQGQKLTKMAYNLPSLCLGIGLLEGPQAPCIQRLTTPKKPSSSREFLKKLSAGGSPQSIFVTPMQAHEARSEAQREPLEPSEEVLISSKLCKPEQYCQESHGPPPHSLLSLSDLPEPVPALQESMADPRNSRFSFLEALTAGDSQFAQETGFAMHNRSPLSEGAGCLQPSADCPSNFEPSLNQSYSNPTCEENLTWEASQQRNPSILASNMDIEGNSQARFPHAVFAASCLPPPVKQEWSTAFKRFPHLYQALSQGKNVPISACDERQSPEKRRKLLSSQAYYASGATDTWSELNGSTSGGTCALYNNADRQSHRNFKQLNVREALEAISCRKANDSRQGGQVPGNLFRPAEVKVEFDHEESYGEQYAYRDSVEENDDIGRCLAKPPLEMGFLGSPQAWTCAPPNCSSMDTAGNLRQSGSNNCVCVQLPQVWPTVSAGGPSVCAHDEQAQRRIELDQQTPPMNRTAQLDGCWGKFLALSASAGVQHTAKGDTKIVVPFQRRFKRLQEFLKQCDTSDKYSLQAFQSLSAAAMSGSAVELETRAVRLSLEEGKELKRMKLLNVLGKASEGAHASSSKAVYVPRLLMPVNIVQVKQEF